MRKTVSDEMMKEATKVTKEVTREVTKEVTKVMRPATLTREFIANTHALA